MKKALPQIVFLGLIVLILGVMFFDSSPSTNNNVQEVKALVLKTDNSEMVQSGLSKIGSQTLKVKVLEGIHLNEELTANNLLLGQLEMDNYYKVGDKIIIGITTKDGQIINVRAVDLYRQNSELLLFSLFVLALLLYAGFTGLKALFSFVASLLVIWKFLIPGLLAGDNPLILSFSILIILSGIIIFSVAGFTKKGLVAFCGTCSGLFVTILITVFFGNQLELLGMTAPYAATLIYSGYLHLNMRQILYAAIVIGASGAAMDISMDIAASMEEIKIKRPDIQTKELIQSGFNIGRTVIGTMTTTLLLAYSGGYLTLLMLFMSKNTSLVRILNLKMVAAEILRTLTGSIGLVLVAPITAIFAGWLYCIEFGKKKHTLAQTQENDQEYTRQ